MRVQSYLIPGELAGKRKYSNRSLNKSTWVAEDHYALFFYVVRTEKMNDRRGIFFQKTLSVDEIDQRIWYCYLKAAAA